MEVVSKKYLCYLLCSETSTKTYIGITNNLEKRIRQHNGERVGGAKYTHSGRPWKVYGCVEGFDLNKSAVLKFEWRWKFLSRKEKGTPLQRRLNSLDKLLNNNDLNLNLLFIKYILHE